MTQKIQRRDFLTGSLAAGAAMATASQSASNSGANNTAKQELCELRIYRNTGSNTNPVFGEFKYLQAGGKDASIPTT